MSKFKINIKLKSVWKYYNIAYDILILSSNLRLDLPRGLYVRFLNRSSNARPLPIRATYPANLFDLSTRKIGKHWWLLWVGQDLCEIVPNFGMNGAMPLISTVLRSATHVSLRIYSSPHRPEHIHTHLALLDLFDYSSMSNACKW